MADKDEWAVVEKKPVIADDWGVAKKGPSDTAQSAPAVEVTAVEESIPTEAEAIGTRTDLSARDNGAQDKKRLSGENAIVGGVAGTIKGLLERYLLSQDKLQKEVYGRALKNVLLQSGIDLSKITDESALIDMARNLSGQQMAGKQAELSRLAQEAEQFRGMLPPEPSTKTGFPSQLDDLAQAGRASGPRVEGASGAANWMRSMAGEGHQIPDVILSSAEDMTKANPRGGQALINQDLARLEKINQLGGGQYQLSGQGRGQLMLPPKEAAAQEAARVSQQADTAKDALKVIQPQIATVEAEIARLTALNKDVSSYAKRLEELRRMEGLAKNSLRGGLVFPAQANVGFLPRFGASMGGKGFLPMFGNVMAGAGAAYDLTEAFDRLSNKDPLGAAVNFVSGALNTAATVPPVNLPLSTVKAVGTLGGLGMIPIKMMLPGRSVMDQVKEILPGEVYPSGRR
jgi:hypothetical protein